MKKTMKRDAAIKEMILTVAKELYPSNASVKKIITGNTNEKISDAMKSDLKKGLFPM